VKRTIFDDFPQSFTAVSTPVTAEPSADSEWVTEAVLGESATVLERRGEWARVVLRWQPSSLHPNGYPGWAPKSSLCPMLRAPVFRTVSGATAARLVAKDREVLLPMGSVLYDAAGEADSGWTFAMTPTGEKVLAPTADVVVDASSPLQGRQCLLDGLGEWSEQPYVWGGTNSVSGLDCSGLVFRAYGKIGVVVPRDANDQFELAPRRESDSLDAALPGDLVFFQRETSLTIDHVGIYLGDGMYLSAYKKAGGVSIHPVAQDRFVGWAAYLDAS